MNDAADTCRRDDLRRKLRQRINDKNFERRTKLIRESVVRTTLKKAGVDYDKFIAAAKEISTKKK
jgi:hypothetical protein